MHKLLLGVAVAALMLTGCATLERNDDSKFLMLSDSQWSMEAMTRYYSKPENAEWEAKRMEWLRQYTTDNGCRSFTVTSRVWTRNPGSFAPEGTGRLLYLGTCVRR